MSDTPHELVERMIQAGPWPEPQILEDIVAAGSDVVEPLLDVLRRDYRGWPEDAALYFSMALLGQLRAAEAMPDLVNILRRYDDDVIDTIEDHLAPFGPAIVPPLLAIAVDRSLGYYPRTKAIEAARCAAGDDIVLQAQIAETLRNELRFYLDNEDTTAEDEMPTWLVNGLTDLADPLARDMIREAFERDRVSTFIIDEECVDEIYPRGGVPAEYETGPWVEDSYKEMYNQHLKEEADALSRKLMRLSNIEGRSTDAAADPVSPSAPIRQVSHRPGRNDPCWCGSGKKYKKCHLPSDDAAES